VATFSTLVGVIPENVNNNLPIALCSDINISASDICLAGADINDGSFDPDGDQITFLQFPAGPFEIGTTEVTMTVTDFLGEQSDCTAIVTVVDELVPSVQTIVPSPDQALLDGVTFLATASDNCGVDEVFFSIREPGGLRGTPIGYEDLEGSFNSTLNRWEYFFDTTQLPDGYYVFESKAVDDSDNEALSELIPFSIRNWAVCENLPATESSKAGRTMPVKFAIKIAEVVDPAMPFVYNEQLEVKIKNNKTGDISICYFGDTSTEYRIDNAMYISNYKTDKKPAEYKVEIWRMNNNFLIGDFTFETVK
jgi:hypothetical protein